MSPVMHRIASSSTRPTPRDRKDAPPVPSSHGREADRLVLDALRHIDSDGGEFLLRRARLEADGLTDRRTARILRRVMDTFCDPDADPEERTGPLLGWAGCSERRGHLTEAAAILSLARELEPENAELALHAARVARLSGQPAEARALYRRVRKLEEEPGPLGRMADVGLALVSSSPEARLGHALRGAVEAGDREAEAVAREARAEVRRRSGRRAAALRDYANAAALFQDPTDQGRIALETGSLLEASGRLTAARRVLRKVVETALPDQAERARWRLAALARAQGDEVSLRRWRNFAASDSC